MWHPNREEASMTKVLSADRSADILKNVVFVYVKKQRWPFLIGSERNG